MTNPALAWSEDGTADGPPLLMGSSLGTTRQMWAPCLDALDEFRVVRFDHLGHGESAVPVGPYTMQQLADSVLALMDHLQIDRASYVGLSLGGALGQWLAINHADRIDRLALVATAPHFPGGSQWAERAAGVRAEGTASVADAAMTRWFPDGYREQNPADIARWRQMVADVDPEGYAGCCEALAGFDVRADLGRITAPTIAIAGADDVSTSPEAMQVIADGIPGCRLEVIEDAAHLPHVPHPAKVGALLANHLRGA